MSIYSRSLEIHCDIVDEQAWKLVREKLRDGPTTSRRTGVSRPGFRRCSPPPEASGFPYARRIIEITRDRLEVSTGRHSVETVYAIRGLAFENAEPRQIVDWSRGHWGIEVRREVALVERSNRLEVAMSDG